jgi:pimeloyl-ACP methyl ester carboxylesterase
VGAARHRFAVAILAAATALPTACGGALEHRSDEAFAASRPVTFITSDGVRLEGRVFGPATATVGLVYAHMLPADASSWFDEAIRQASAGYRTLAFNFRGYCPGADAGCSGGEKAPDLAAVDLEAAVTELRSLGVAHVGLIGASMGGTAALVVAGTDPSQIEIVITLSAPTAIGGLGAGPDVLAEVTAASLFVAGTGDGDAADAASSFYAQAAQPKRLEIVPSDDHGTDMLTGSAGGRVRDLIDVWLGTHLPPGTSGAPS